MHTHAVPGMARLLQQQNEDIRRRLSQTTHKMEAMETEFETSRHYMQAELGRTRDDLEKMRDKFRRLQNSYTASQRANQDLEEKLHALLRKVERDKKTMDQEIVELTNKLVDAKNTIDKLEELNERYRQDCNLAVQLLKCNKSHFRNHKFADLVQNFEKGTLHQRGVPRRTAVPGRARRPPEIFGGPADGAPGPRPARGARGRAGRAPSPPGGRRSGPESGGRGQFRLDPHGGAVPERPANPLNVRPATAPTGGPATRPRTPGHARPADPLFVRQPTKSGGRLGTPPPAPGHAPVPRTHYSSNNPLYSPNVSGTPPGHAPVPRTHYSSNNPLYLRKRPGTAPGPRPRPTDPLFVQYPLFFFFFFFGRPDAQRSDAAPPPTRRVGIRAAFSMDVSIGVPVVTKTTRLRSAGAPESVAPSAVP
ncbi:tight junction-associated protein [Pimephales promelas]|nr:tight junction-associated protein [Pimephales promelas]